MQDYFRWYRMQFWVLLFMLMCDKPTIVLHKIYVYIDSIELEAEKLDVQTKQKSWNWEMNDWCWGNKPASYLCGINEILRAKWRVRASMCLRWFSVNKPYALLLRVKPEFLSTSCFVLSWCQLRKLSFAYLKKRWSWSFFRIKRLCLQKIYRQSNS